MNPRCSNFIWASCMLFLVLLGGCQKENLLQSDVYVLRKLYRIHEQGSIDVCWNKNEKVYLGGFNAKDEPVILYDESGDRIGSCNFVMGQYHSLCFELKNCETVYRCSKHISLLPPLDTYGLTKLK